MKSYPALEESDGQLVDGTTKINRNLTVGILTRKYELLRMMKADHKSLGFGSSIIVNMTNTPNVLGGYTYE